MIMKQIAQALAILCIGIIMIISINTGTASGVENQKTIVQPQQLATGPTSIKPNTERRPVVIMLSGADGPFHYNEFSDKLEKLGYYVLLLDSRKFPYEDTESCKLKLSEEINRALSSPNAISGKVVVIGYSLGGWIALSAASNMPKNVSTVIAYYPNTKWIKDLKAFANRFEVPILVFQGEADIFRNCCTIERIREISFAAKERGKNFDLVVYPGVGHCFNVQRNPSFIFYSISAADSWQRTLDALKKYYP
jgi:dienelactone hydrolase